MAKEAIPQSWLRTAVRDYGDLFSLLTASGTPSQSQTSGLNLAGSVMAFQPGCDGGHRGPVQAGRRAPVSERCY